MQSLFRAIYPPRCLTCAEIVAEDGGLCGPCWRGAGFVSGLVCDACGVPLPGQADHAVLCDDCLALPRPWRQGRAALIYRDTGRKLVLALKHGDRTDLVETAAGWMRRAAAPILTGGQLVVPVPLHWRRLVARRYNQSALLARALARQAGLDHCPDALRRARATPSQDGRDREARFANLGDALVAQRPGRLNGRDVLLVDDVMTSGATFAAAAEACRAAGARDIRVLALARVAKDI
jgi:ComF family protein